MKIDTLTSTVRMQHPVYSGVRYCYVKPEIYSLVGETFERNWKFEIEFNRISVFFTPDELANFRPEDSNHRFTRTQGIVLIEVHFS